MPNSNLAAYLAKNYLTASTTSTPPDSDFADSTRPKKKRKKNKEKEAASGGGGLIIADDDEDLSLRKTLQDQNDDNEIPIFETNVKSAEFRKKKGGSGWKVVSEPTTTTTPGNNNTNNDSDGDAAAAEADRILAEAENEARQRRREIEDEDAPAIVDTDSVSAPVMASGVRAGLQTAEDTAALIAREQKESKKKSKSKEEKPQEEETIYRDATGRRIDISMKRAEARAAELERIKAEKKAREEAMGEVQRREKEARKQQLDEAKFMTLARGADDEEMNDMLRRQKRWDDPMAGYIAEREEDNGEGQLVKSKTKAIGKEKAGGGGGAAAGRKKNPRVYAGHAPPNRYGILPGWRWDGVDRSTGFEKEWFQARSRSARVEELKYQWQMDE
ncbi:Pre-mRNA-splicing factor cwc26 [Exophiala dermatitidis]